MDRIIDHKDSCSEYMKSIGSALMQVLMLI